MHDKSASGVGRGLDEASLIAFMDEQVDGFAGPLSISQFAGGASNPTFKLETPGQSYVLRRKPPGKLLKGAHAVEREYRVIKALEGTGFPVPRAYALCEDTDVLGSAFYIMECVEGRIYSDFRLPDFEPEERRAFFASQSENLAKLHKLDHVALGLEDFGRHGNFFGRQIALWSRQFENSAAPILPKIAKLIVAMPGAIPEGDEACIVHGDFLIQNLLVHPTKPEIAAVLDWELSTIGHPLADLFYNAMPYYMPDSAGMSNRSYVNWDYEAAGLPSLERHLQDYCDHMGRRPINNPSFYKAFILFRLAGIVRGIIDRIKGGNANDPRANADQLTLQLNDLSDAAFQFAQEAGVV